MTTIFIELAFFICLALTVKRFVGKSKRSNVALMGAAVLTTAAVGLMIPAVYNFVDPFLSRTNMADLVSKVCLILAVALLGGQCAKAMNNQTAIWLTAKWPGTAALLVAVGLLFAAFLAIPDGVRSPALRAYASLPATKLSTAVVLAYIGYVALANLKAVVTDARTNPLRSLRTSSTFLACGFALALVRCLLFAVEFKYTEFFAYAQLVSMASTALVAIGCAISWQTARTTAKRTIYSKSFLSADD